MAEDPERKRERERQRYAALTPEEKQAKGRAANERTKARLERAKKLEYRNSRLKRQVRERYKSKYGGEPLLDFVPFRMWLIYKEREYGSVPALAQALDLDEGNLRRFLKGYTWDRPRIEGPDWCGPTPISSVTIQIVDHCLTNEGSIRLDDLYPHIDGWDDDPTES